MSKQFATDNAVVDPSRHVYVPRFQDAELLGSIRSTFLTHIQGSRMSGKSSLLFHAKRSFEEQGVCAPFADLATVVGGPATPLDASRMIVSTLARRAGLPVPGVVTDKSVRVPVDVFVEGFNDMSAAQSPGDSGAPRLVLLLDELDAVASEPWSAGFFSTLRDLATRRELEPALPGVRIVLAGVRPFRNLVADPVATGVSPHNAMWLDDFVNDAASAAALQEGFPRELREQAPALAWKALEFSGGYPQACLWLCHQMVAERLDADLGDLEQRLIRLADRARRSSTPPAFFSAPEEYLRSYAGAEPTVTDDNPHQSVVRAMWIYLDLLRGNPVEFDSSRPAHLVLRWSGLARCDQVGVLHVRSPLLSRFYTLDWSHKVRRSLERRPRRPGPDRPIVKPKNHPHVAVLMTGGTIGMVEDEGGKVRPPQDMAELNFAYAEVERFAEVEFTAILGGDSADITPEHWGRIAQEVAERVRNPKIDGIVVGHGTDTLAYTASAVAFALGPNLNKPVVFTGSQATRDVAHGDARANLLRACKVAAEAKSRLPEVVICFGDLVLRACRAQKRDDRRFDAFESPLCPPLAVVAEEVEYADFEIRRHRSTPPPMDVRTRFDSRILTISQVPGLRPALLEPMLNTAGAENGLRAIIIESLGAGNLPTRREYSLVGFIDKAAKKDIPVVLTSPYPVLMSNPSKYAPAEAAVKAGALPLFNITLPALVAKLSWILGSMPDGINHEDPSAGRRREWVREQIRSDYIGEADVEDMHFGPYR